MNALIDPGFCAKDLPLASFPQAIAWHAGVLAKIKIELDRVLSDPHPSMRWECLRMGMRATAALKTIPPEVFAKKVIPFYAQCSRSLVAEANRVPAIQVVGENNRWQMGDLTNNEQESVIQASEIAMDRFLAYGDEDDEVAHFTLIEPFGLYVANKGLHRVSLYCERHQQSIPALVSTVDYPSAKRIVVYRTSWNRSVAVLDRRWLFPLTMSTCQVPMLVAYGVPVCDWPRDLRCDRHEIELWVVRQQSMDTPILPPIDGVNVLHEQQELSWYPMPA